MESADTGQEALMKQIIFKLKEMEKRIEVQLIDYLLEQTDKKENISLKRVIRDLLKIQNYQT